MSVAKQFLENLQKGDINEAIESIQSGLRESTVEQVKEHRQSILESYGFKINEQTFYAIRDTKTKKVISTHDNEADAKDEAEGLGAGVEVVKTKKAPKGWSMKESKEDKEEYFEEDKETDEDEPESDSDEDEKEKDEE